jgi:hypothetical protein
MATSPQTTPKQTLAAIAKQLGFVIEGVVCGVANHPGNNRPWPRWRLVVVWCLTSGGGMAWFAVVHPWW